jgi:hypothetical protein
VWRKSHQTRAASWQRRRPNASASTNMAAALHHGTQGALYAAAGAGKSTRCGSRSRTWLEALLPAADSKTCVYDVAMQQLPASAGWLGCLRCVEPGFASSPRCTPSVQLKSHFTVSNQPVTHLRHVHAGGLRASASGVSIAVRRVLPRQTQRQESQHALIMSSAYTKRLWVRCTCLDHLFAATNSSSRNTLILHGLILSFDTPCKACMLTSVLYACWGLGASA